MHQVSAYHNVLWHAVLPAQLLTVLCPACCVLDYVTGMYGATVSRLETAQGMVCCSSWCLGNDVTVPAPQLEDVWGALHPFLLPRRTLGNWNCCSVATCHVALSALHKQGWPCCVLAYSCCTCTAKAEQAAFLGATDIDTGSSWSACSMCLLRTPVGVSRLLMMHDGLGC